MNPGRFELGLSGLTVFQNDENTRIFLATLVDTGTGYEQVWCCLLKCSPTHGSDPYWPGAAADREL